MGVATEMLVVKAIEKLLAEQQKTNQLLEQLLHQRASEPVQWHPAR